MEFAGMSSRFNGCAGDLSILAQGSRTGTGVWSERRALAGADPAGGSSLCTNIPRTSGRRGAGPAGGAEPRHFSILFKKTVGDSFITFNISASSVSPMASRETSLTMQEIAEKTGLGDSKYFSKWFKRARVRRQANTVPNKRGTIVNK